MAGGKFSNSLLKKITKIVRDYSKAACEQVRQEWARSADEEGKAEIKYTVEDAENVVIAAIYATGQKMWVLEYGKGSKMETASIENPFLDEYLRGQVKGADGKPLFNRERLGQGLKILGRPKGTYLDLDDAEHKTSGTFAGYVLESSEENASPYAVSVLPPRKIIKNVLFGQNNDGVIAEVEKEINKAVGELALKVMSTFPKTIKILKG